ncbi:MAG TPA: cupin domain-containing protein [Baekduia sp.]|nr:cupin domain-containing protein [Baekduia sp.]
MTFRTLAALAACTLVPTGAIGVASATAPSGVSPVEHVAGARLAKKVDVDADGVRFQTTRRTEVSVLTLTVAPGGSTGWHTHPGLAVISVAQGTGKLYATDCTSRTFTAGEAFVEAGDDKATLFRNEGSAPVVLTVTFIAPRRAAVIRDERAPRTCRLR